MRKPLQLFFVFLSLNVWGQDLKSVERNLIQHYHRITDWKWSNAKGAYDSLESENEKFKNILLQCTSTIPATLTYPFDSLLAEVVTISTGINFTASTSPDKNFRIYSWDTWEGGTMHFFDNIVQYKIGDKVFSTILYRDEAEGDPGCFFSTIYSAHLGGKTYYLAKYISVLSSKDDYAGIRVFTIENGALNDTISLIKTTAGLRNDIGYGFNHTGLALEYDDTNKVIKVPEVLDDGTTTNKFVEYKFTGNYFEEQK